MSEHPVAEPAQDAFEVFDSELFKGDEFPSAAELRDASLAYRAAVEERDYRELRTEILNHLKGAMIGYPGSRRLSLRIRDSRAKDRLVKELKALGYEVTTSSSNGTTSWDVAWG